MIEKSVQNAQGIGRLYPDARILGQDHPRRGGIDIKDPGDARIRGPGRLHLAETRLGVTEDGHTRGQGPRRRDGIDIRMIETDGNEAHLHTMTGMKLASDGELARGSPMNEMFNRI